MGILTELLAKMAAASLWASCIAAAVCIICLLARKLPGKYRCMLWTIAFLGFFVPSAVRIPCSLPQTGLLGGAFEKQEIQKDDLESVQTAHGQSTALQKTKLPGKTDAYPANLTAFIWLAGILILLCMETVRYAGLKRKLKTAVRQKDGIYISDRIASPFLFGIASPRIYLPAKLNVQTAQFAVLHEQMHKKRKDYLVKAATFFVCVCYWWNPLLWLMYRLLERDMERACDEAVLEYADVPCASYAQSLLDAALAGSHPAFGMEFAGGTTKRRVKNILSFRRITRRKNAACILLVLGVLVISAVRPDVHAQQEMQSGTIKEEWERLVADYPDYPPHIALNDYKPMGTWAKFGTGGDGLYIRLNGILEEDGVDEETIETTIAISQKLMERFEELDNVYVCYWYTVRKQPEDFRQSEARMLCFSRKGLLDE